jgi:hypothetical protein
MCAFGGPNLDVMYVTTASSFLKKGEGVLQRHAGKLFAIRGLGAIGMPEFKFGSHRSSHPMAKAMLSARKIGCIMSRSRT